MGRAGKDHFDTYQRYGEINGHTPPKKGTIPLPYFDDLSIEQSLSSQNDLPSSFRAPSPLSNYVTSANNAHNSKNQQQQRQQAPSRETSPYRLRCLADRPHDCPNLAIPACGTDDRRDGASASSSASSLTPASTLTPAVPLAATASIRLPPAMEDAATSDQIAPPSSASIAASTAQGPMASSIPSITISLASDVTSVGGGGGGTPSRDEERNKGEGETFRHGIETGMTESLVTEKCVEKMATEVEKERSKEGREIAKGDDVRGTTGKVDVMEEVMADEMIKEMEELEVVEDASSTSEWDDEDFELLAKSGSVIDL